MSTKSRVVFDLNTRVKVIHASERDKLSVMKAYQDAVRSLKELQEFAVQRNDMLSVISQAEVFAESQAAKTLLESW
jgi:hypothetical protein